VKVVGFSCEEVKQMLIADRAQNYKDFMLHHCGKHERSGELYKYFNNWFELLKQAMLNALKRYWKNSRLACYVGIAGVLLMLAHFGLFYIQITLGPASLSIGNPH